MLKKMIVGILLVTVIGAGAAAADIQSLVAYLRSLEITAPPIVPPILDGQ